MHGPDPARQAPGTDPAPEPLGTGLFHVADPFGHVQCGETGRTGHYVGQQHQKGVVRTVEDDLPVLRQLGNELQTKPLHSMPRLCAMSAGECYGVAWFAVRYRAAAE